MWVLTMTPLVWTALAVVGVLATIGSIAILLLFKDAAETLRNCWFGEPASPLPVVTVHQHAGLGMFALATNLPKASEGDLRQACDAHRQSVCINKFLVRQRDNREQRDIWEKWNLIVFGLGIDRGQAARILRESGFPVADTSCEA